MLQKKYRSIAKISMQNTIAYRFNFLISLSASFIFILSMFYVWKSIFAGRPELSGFTWQEMKTYLFITFLTNAMLSWYSETKISHKILDGSVAMDLLKPLDFQKARLAETIGTSVFEGWVAILLISIVVASYAGVTLPDNFGTGFLFLLSIAASLIIKFGIVYIAGIFCFWTTSWIGIAWTRAALTNLFSGALIPLTFFPDSMKMLASYLPFQGIVYIPASIYLGRVDGYEALKLVALQLFWVIALWMIGKLMWGRAIRQVTIHGG